MTNNLSILSSKLDRDIMTAVAELKSFAAFDQWMDEQLDVLVGRWIHTAAPNANRFEQVQRSFGR